MIIYDKQLKASLDSLGLPVYYENIVDSTVKTPCITYLPATNTDYLSGLSLNDTLSYSYIDYYVKIWGHSKETLMPYMEQLNDLMVSLGFRRSSYQELATDTELCLVSLWKGIGFEKL